MKVTEISLYINPNTVIERFPEHEEAIMLLFKNNQNFKALCSDYRKCARALEFWSKSDLCEAPQRQKEYQTLLAELEKEIAENLKNKRRKQQNRPEPEGDS